MDTKKAILVTLTKHAYVFTRRQLKQIFSHRKDFNQSYDELVAEGTIVQQINEVSRRLEVWAKDAPPFELTVRPNVHVTQIAKPTEPEMPAYVLKVSRAVWIAFGVKVLNAPEDQHLDATKELERHLASYQLTRVVEEVVGD